MTDCRKQGLGVPEAPGDMGAEHVGPSRELRHNCPASETREHSRYKLVKDLPAACVQWEYRGRSGGCDICETLAREGCFVCSGMEPQGGEITAEKEEATLRSTESSFYLL